MRIFIHRKAICPFAAFAVFYSLALPEPALATYSDCIAPIEPALPSVLNSQTEADIWYAVMDEHSRLAANHLRCLRDYATADDAELTPQQKHDLQKIYDESVADLQETTVEWNNVFGEYQGKRAAQSQ